MKTVLQERESNTSHFDIINMSKIRKKKLKDNAIHVQMFYTYFRLCVCITICYTDCYFIVPIPVPLLGGVRNSDITGSAKSVNFAT